MKIQGLFCSALRSCAPGRSKTRWPRGARRWGTTAWRRPGGSRKRRWRTPRIPRRRTSSQARCAFRRGEFARADAEFKSAIELNPRLAQAWWGLGRVAECACDEPDRGGGLPSRVRVESQGSADTARLDSAARRARERERRWKSTLAEAGATTGSGRIAAADGADQGAGRPRTR